MLKSLISSGFLGLCGTVVSVDPNRAFGAQLGRVCAVFIRVAMIVLALGRLLCLNRCSSWISVLGGFTLERTTPLHRPKLIAY